MRRRRLAASVATVVLVTGTVVTAFALHSLPDRSRTASHALDVAAGIGRPAVDATSGTPLPGSRGTTSPGPTSPAATAGTTTTATATKPATTKPSPSAKSSPSTPAAPAGSGTAPLAGRIKPGVTYHGVATWYSTDGGGACRYDSGGDPMTAAMNWSDYEGSKACGAYVLVRASNGATVKVRITNECPAPCRVHQLDLSPQAFAKLADPKTGQLDVTWQLLSPQISGAISVRHKVGSSQYWCGIHLQFARH